MQRFLTLAVLVIFIALTGTALAGERHVKCTEDTQVCLDRLTAKLKAKGWLGVELDKTDKGWYKVTAVTADSPAQVAGFQAGDMLVALNGVVLSEDNKEALGKVKKGLGPGKAATYTVKRSGAKQQLAVTLSHMPGEMIAEWIGQHMVENHAVAVIAAK